MGGAHWGLRYCSIAVLDNFSCGILVILILKCGITVFSEPCRMRDFSILDGIQNYLPSPPAFAIFGDIFYSIVVFVKFFCSIVEFRTPSNGTIWMY